MRLSDEEIAREKARQSNILRRAELAEKKGYYQKAADLFGEAADAATNSAICIVLAERQMTNFFRATSAQGTMMPKGTRTPKAS